MVYELESSARGSDPNGYSMCEGGLLLHSQYDAVQIGFITQFPTMGATFSVVFLQGGHAQPLN